MRFTKSRETYLHFCAAGVLVFGWLIGVTPAAVKPRVAAKPAQTLPHALPVTLTTSSDGKWTYISVSPSQAGTPLAAAYIVEYAVAAKRLIHFSGQAMIETTNNALQVKPEAGIGWIFVLSQYHKGAPAGVAVVRGLAGIIRFDTQSLTAVVRPVSHADFVARAHKLVLGIMKGGLAHCQCGGVGAAACTLQAAVSVACSRGYFACCRDGACASIPAPADSVPAR